MHDTTIAILKSYATKMIRIEQLQFELAHPSLIGEKELIDSLSLGQSLLLGGGSQRGHISNRTMEIALQYDDIRQRMNNETVAEIMRELDGLSAEVQRIELYVSLLDERKAKIIRLRYFEDKTLEQISQEIQVTKRTVTKLCNEALIKLSSMFAYIDSVKGKQS